MAQASHTIWFIDKNGNVIGCDGYGCIDMDISPATLGSAYEQAKREGWQDITHCAEPLLDSSARERQAQDKRVARYVILRHSGNEQPRLL